MYVRTGCQGPLPLLPSVPVCSSYPTFQDVFDLSPSQYSHLSEASNHLFKIITLKEEIRTVLEELSGKEHIALDKNVFLGFSTVDFPQCWN